MNQVHVQQIECLIVLSEELHFGRAAERLGYSRSRVSQLVAALERRVGVRLVQRTSRRVALTRFGAQFVEEVRPAYEALAATFARARDRAMRGRCASCASASTAASTRRSPRPSAACAPGTR
ncbi:LysR family transcriptional regulator [Nocardiopsis composta]